jgi:hypothetical protein
LSEQVINEPKKIFSFNLKKNNIARLDLLRSEPVTRSELMDALLEYLLDNPDFVCGFVREIQNKTLKKVEECIING